MQTEWTPIGKVKDLIQELNNLGGLKEITLQEKRIVLTYSDENFGALDARCNHMGGPLAHGKLKKGCIECPWHYWQFDHKTGKAANNAHEPLAISGGVVSSYPLKIEDNTLLIDIQNASARVKPTFNHNMPGTKLMRDPKREPGKIRVLGISTTAMDPQHPRYSTSEDLLKSALKKAETDLDVETQFLALADLKFRHCEGFYSKSEKACTWPCSITKLDPTDEMEKVYEGLVHWADVVVVGSPIRWGNASSLYYKMAERLNSVQNQITVKNKVLIQNKVAAFIITGGQDGVQAVAGQMLNFFGELGFVSPSFPYVAHSLGWSAENMQLNMESVASSEYLHQQSFELVERAVALSRKILN